MDEGRRRAGASLSGKMSEQKDLLGNGNEDFLRSHLLRFVREADCASPMVCNEMD